MSIKVASWVREHSKAPKGGALAVLLAIADLADHNGVVPYPRKARVGELAKMTRLGERTVRRHLATVRELGELRITEIPGDYNRYEVLLRPPGAAPVTPAKSAPVTWLSPQVTPRMTPLPFWPVTPAKMAAPIEEDPSSTHPSPPPVPGEASSRARARPGGGGDAPHQTQPVPESPGSHGSRAGPGQLSAMLERVRAELEAQGVHADDVAAAIEATRLRLVDGGLTAPGPYAEAVASRLAAERASRPPPASTADELAELCDRVQAIDPGAWRHETGWMLSDGANLLDRHALAWLAAQEGRAPPAAAAGGASTPPPAAAAT